MNMQEEIICNFKVSSERKKVWATELEMVKIFKNICEENNLKYFVSGGTLIGAIRHNGFIPWDDDIDIMMPRSDYEKFLNIGQAYLPENFFLQYNKTEKRYPNGHAQIRNNNTTCFTSTSYKDLKSGKNCGIFIDIFPYDEVPNDTIKRNKQARKVAFLKKMCSYKVYSFKQSKLKKLIKTIISGVYFTFHSVEKKIEKINALSQKYNGQTDTVALISFMPGYEKNVWDKALFDNAVMHKFEDIEIAIPEKYDAVLRLEFGDYMQIPKDLGGSIHGKCFFDTGKSYKKYLNYTSKQIDNLIKNFVL